MLKEPGVDAKHVGATGFCFGGTTVVTFHGGLKTANPDDAKNIRGPVNSLQAK